MSQSTQQHAAPARARRDWELFWRIVAGLMLIVIAWIIWVLYQITPRSVVTPLAYESRSKPIGTPAAASPAVAALPPGAIAPAPQAEASAGRAGMPMAQGAAETGAANPAMEQAQAAARAGAHQASADVQAAALGEAREKAQAAEHSTQEGLKLSTEIVTPPAGRR